MLTGGLGHGVVLSLLPLARFVGHLFAHSIHLPALLVSIA
jgi:hypothetical protein